MNAKQHERIEEKEKKVVTGEIIPLLQVETENKQTRQKIKIQSCFCSLVSGIMEDVWWGFVLDCSSFEWTTRYLALSAIFFVSTRTRAQMLVLASICLV